MIGKFVIIRTYSAGVHCGTLIESSNTAVLLRDARRIYRWRGANTLNELSLRGAAKEYTRISEPVEEITLTQAIEIIPCTQLAQDNLSESRWGE